VTRKASGGRDEGPASGETRPGSRGDAVGDRSLQVSRWSYGLYVVFVIAGTAVLLHGRPPLTDKSLSWVETLLLLPGLIFYLPLMLLSGGIHWSVLPLRSQVLERRYRVLSRVADQGPPAWTRWAVPLAAITGAVVGGVLVYGEMRILRWSQASAGVLAVAATALTLAMAWIIFRLVRKQR
jgi:hypothetical protein